MNTSTRKTRQAAYGNWGKVGTRRQRRASNKKTRQEGRRACRAW